MLRTTMEAALLGALSVTVCLFIFSSASLIAAQISPSKATNDKSFQRKAAKHVSRYLSGWEKPQALSECSWEFGALLVGLCEFRFVRSSNTLVRRFKSMDHKQSLKLLVGFEIL